MPIMSLDELPQPGGDPDPEVVNRLEEAADRLAGLESDREETFAGVFTAGETLYVGSTAPEALLRDLDPILGTSIHYRVFRADLSLAELREVARQVSTDLRYLRDELGIPVSTVYTGIRENRVVIGLAGASESGVQSLRERYGPSRITTREMEVFGASSKGS